MAPSDFLSDTDDSTVDELISQIQDLSVLEQVSKINTSAFTGSLLPSHLETRFQKLKSNNTLPFSNPKQNPDSQEQNPDGENGFKEKKSKSGSISDLEKIDSFKDSMKEKLNPDDEFSFDDKNPNWGNELIKEKNLELKSGSLGSSSSSMDSPSPPRKGGCFWFSPKKRVPKKKKIEKWNMDWGNKDDDLMEVLRSFSGKEGEKILKKAKEEEEKINRETEKIAKLASKRLSF